MYTYSLLPEITSLLLLSSLVLKWLSTHKTFVLRCSVYVALLQVLGDILPETTGLKVALCTDGTNTLADRLQRLGVYNCTLALKCTPASVTI